MRSTDQQLVEIFNTVDTDGSGTISMDEYFLFALSIAAQQTGSGIEAIFRKYDKSGEGSLDASEFSRAVEDMGFGSIAHELFLELDRDESGSVSYGELIKLLQERTSSVGRECKRFLTALAFDRASGDGTGVELDTSKWKLEVSSADELREKLQAYLLETSARVSDLYNALTFGNQKELSKNEWLMAMYRVGFEGEPEIVQNLYDVIDIDESGNIGIDELYGWMNGRNKRAMKAKEINFGMRDEGAPPLRDLDWSGSQGPSVLQHELQRLLILIGLAPLDLMRGWDQGQDGSFSRKEFLVMMKKILNDSQLWDDELREVCKDTFKIISGGDKTLDVIEFERWLNKGWLRHKAELVDQHQVAKLKGANQTKKAASGAANVAALLSGGSSKKKPGSIFLNATGNKRSQEESEYLAACVLQRGAKKFVFKKQAALVLQRDMTEAKAAIILQTRWRAKMSSRRVAAKRQAMIEHNAAVRLQTRYRVRLAKKHREKMLEQRAQRAASPLRARSPTSPTNPPPNVGSRSPPPLSAAPRAPSPPHPIKGPTSPARAARISPSLKSPHSCISDVAHLDSPTRASPHRSEPVPALQGGGKRTGAGCTASIPASLSSPTGHSTVSSLGPAATDEVKRLKAQIDQMRLQHAQEIKALETQLFCQRGNLESELMKKYNLHSGASGSSSSPTRQISADRNEQLHKRTWNELLQMKSEMSHFKERHDVVVRKNRAMSAELNKMRGVQRLGGRTDGATSLPSSPTMKLAQAPDARAFRRGATRGGTEAQLIDQLIFFTPAPAAAPAVAPRAHALGSISTHGSAPALGSAPAAFAAATSPAAARTPLRLASAPAHRPVPSMPAHVA